MPDLATTAPFLEMKAISKQFPKVLANDNISIRLEKGEILSFLGENGAGKSTLMNILYGLYRPTEGEIFIEGRKVEFSSPKDAITAGLGMVHQHFMLVENLSVTENIILGNEPVKAGVINYREAREKVRNLSEMYHLAINPDDIIENVSVGLQQRVEILKALYRQAKILILDEPTAVLTPHEVEEFFSVIRKLRERDVSIIIITHKLEEVTAISDRVYILRKGKLAGERKTSETTKEELANLMVGREVILTVTKDEKIPGENPVLTISDLTVKGDNKLTALKSLSLSVRPGEIVGIAGVDGNGQRELAEAIIGLRPVSSGSILFDDKDVAHWTTRERIEAFISYVPADRQRYGLILPMMITENVTLGKHLKPPFSKGINLNLKYIEEFAAKLVQDFDIRTPSVTQTASTLSGGNQQKVILAREFSRKPRFLLISQPTRGLDVGAIEYIHSQIIKMRDADVAILLISLELEEIFSLSDRIMVLYEGAIVKEFDAKDTNERQVGLYMTGAKEQAAV
ncbi:MAG: ABC transporter ATP-binding protein [Spirochaetales bacterium]|nr:MAG: ABC transporter ATP-binding protein [Spirochaetales bacterium]